MLTLRPADGRLKPPWWRTAVLVVVAFIGTLLSLVYSPPSVQMDPDAPDNAATLMIMAGFLLAVIASVGLVWRHRHPLVWVVAASVLSLVLPLGNTLPYITLAALVGRRRGSAVWAAAGLVAVTSTWVIVADAAAQPREASVLKTLFGPTGGDPTQPVDVSTAAVVITTLLGWSLAVGIGLLLRGRRESVASHEFMVQERRTSSVLGDEVARRAERELIAREVHDVLGHRLSLLSLHAGALEANALKDPRLRSSAELVRSSAAGAMQDLQSLLGVLRSPAGEQQELPLTQLPHVVEESFGAGQLLASSIFIQDAEQASPTLSRAVYRIVQELVTNSRKHAPGARTTLKITGSPDQGIVIDVINAVLPGSGPASGSGRGLTGIAERAELLGGRVRHGLDRGGTVFRVLVELPWQAATADG